MSQKDFVLHRGACSMASFRASGGGSAGHIRSHTSPMKGLFMAGFKAAMKLVRLEEDDTREWRRSGGCEVGSPTSLDLQ
jgi:hypothetical protein